MMKKIFALVLLLVLGKLSYAQYPITQTLGSDSTIVISKGALQSRLINVTYTDTTAANLQRIRQYPGAQIATTTGGLNLWIRNATATAWIPVATGSGNNIYTIDGTLLGNRTLTGAGYSLTFNQLSKLLFNADSTTINTDQATISNNGVSTLSVKGATGRMFLVDTTAPADERIYELKSSNGEFYISILNDAQTSNDSAFLITSASRAGINTLNPDSTLKVGGGVNILGGLRVGNLPTSPGTKQLRINAQGQFSVTDTLIDAGGTVTSVATNDGTGITGGTITTSGTLAIDTTIISTRAWRQKGVDSLQANINLKLNISDTANMLNPYLRKVDTTNIWITNVYRKTATDSVFYVKGGNSTFAYRDSIGSGGGGGGGGKVYYLNGSVNQGTFGGLTMYALGDTAITGASADFTRATTGIIANFITNVNQPYLISIPSGIWVINAYMSESGGGANHAEVYAILETWNGSTLTSIATSPIEEITNGSTPDLYTFGISLPTTTISLTDRIVIQFYIQNTNGKTVTLYTQNGKVGEVITTFTTGIGALNGLTAPSQFFATGTSGTDFNISSVTATHTFNLPVASGTNTGKLSNTDWTTFNNKVGGSLVNGYITKATGTNTIDTSQLFQSSGLIGIGTTSPTQKLQVSGNAYVNGQLFAGDTALSTYQVEGILTTPYVLGRKAVDNTLSTEARPTGIQGHVVGRGSIANRLQGGTFYATTDSASTANSTGSLRGITSWSSHNGSGSLTTAWGGYNIVQNKTTGTITNAYGSVSGVENRGATSTINKLHGTTTEIWNNYGGTIDTAFGQVISIYNNNAASNIGAVYGLSIGKGLISASGGTHYWRNSGTIGTSYGLYLDSSIDVGTTKYALFSNSNSNSYFRAKLGVGTTSPDSAFQVATGAYFQRGIRASGLPQAPGTKALRIDASGTISYADTLVDAGGTVTSVATNNGTGITGGTITTTGTLAIDTLLISTRAWRQKGIDSVAALINSNVSGTTNYVSKFTGTSTIGNSSIFDNGSNVGIGTASPASTPGYRTLSLNGTSGSILDFKTNGTSRYQIYGDATRLAIENLTGPGGIYLNQSNGYVGIATTGPDSLLTVNGSTHLKNAVRMSGLPTGTGTKSLRVDANGTVSLADTLANGISGTGTTNYIPKFTSSSAIGNSVIYESGGSIGINTTSPTANYPLTLRSQVGDYTKILDWGTDAGGSWGTMTINIASPYQTILSSGAWQFNTGGSERMRLDASGNLGLGTSSPAYKLDVSGGDLRVSSSSNTRLLLNNTSANGKNYSIYSNDAGNLIIGRTGIADYVTIADGGNLGLGVTPSAWRSTDKVLQINNSSLFDENGTNLWLGLNFYENTSGSYIYTNTGYATAYRQQTGQHNWFTAASGTAGNAISFTQAMTLFSTGNLAVGGTSDNGSRVRITGATNEWGIDLQGSSTTSQSYGVLVRAGTNSSDRAFQITNSASSSTYMVVQGDGNVGIGTTSPGYKLDVSGDINLSDGNSLRIGTQLIANRTGNEIRFGSGTAGDYLVYYAGASERMRITSGGNVGIGTTSPSGLLQLNGSIATSGDAATFTIKQSSTTYTNGIYLERGGERNGYYMYIGGGSDALTFRRNYFGTQSDVMSLTRDGNVGIGTTSPIDKLNIVGGATFMTSISAPTNTSIGSLQIGYDGTNGVIRTWNSSPLITSTYNYQAFETNGSERMRITSGGEVGIGTSSPNTKLTINNGGANTSTNYQFKNISVTGGFVSGYTGTAIQSIIAGYDATVYGTDIGYGYDGAGYTLMFSTNDDLSGNPIERMRITSGGELLINTTSDVGDYKLQVNGNVRASNSYSSTTSTNNTNIGTSTFLTDYNFIGSDAYWGIKTTTTGKDFAIDTYNSGTPKNVLTITQAGNVGIGTTSPSAKLQIKQSTSNWYDGIRVFDGNSNTWIGLGNTGSLAVLSSSWDNTGSFLPLAFYTSDVERMRITSGGELLINTTTDAGAYYLQVNGDVYAGAYYESSDRRLKDILSIRGGSDGINTVTFKWKDQRDSLSHIGYIAQEVEKVLPDAVKTNPNGYKTINYDEVQSLKIANLEQEIAELKKVIKQLIDKK